MSADDDKTIFVGANGQGGLAAEAASAEEGSGAGARRSLARHVVSRHRAPRQGRHGEIYEAEGPGGERVVVKLLRRELAKQADMIDRMRVEAQALLTLSHPNIVQAAAFATAPDGRPYLVLERLTGRTLQDELVTRGALPVLEAIGYVRQLLAGLRAVHDAGIVHRDIKPENLMLCRQPGKATVLKVLDFGVAKITEGAIRASGLVPLAYPTMAGACVGTPATPRRSKRGAAAWTSAPTSTPRASSFTRCSPGASFSTT